MGWNSFDRQLNNGPYSATFAVWKWTVFVLLLVGATGVGAWVLSKPFSIVGSTLDGNNVKTNYEWFKQTHEDILAIDVQIRQAQSAVDQLKAEAGPRETWYREDREEHSRLVSVVQGLKQQRANMAADYNARSRMANRSIFKGTDTPDRIETE